MNKNFEITLLDALKSEESYFSDTFTIAEINTMQENIKNDFPITLNTDWLRLTISQRNLIKQILTLYEINVRSLSPDLMTEDQRLKNREICEQIKVILEQLKK